MFLLLLVKSFVNSAVNVSIWVRRPMVDKSGYLYFCFRKVQRIERRNSENSDTFSSMEECLAVFEITGRGGCGVP